MIASYEVSRRRMPVSLLPQIATTLAVTVEDLIGQNDSVPARRGPAPKAPAADRAHPEAAQVPATFCDGDARHRLAAGRTLVCEEPTLNTRRAQSLIDKLQRLPPERQAEVEDFVDFLRSREGDQRLVSVAARASAPAFAAVWDNQDDAEYDRL